MSPTVKDWFDCFNASAPTRDLARLKELLRSGHLDAQDEWGCTGLFLAVASDWIEAVRVLLEAGADTELRHYRTGETALYGAVQGRKEAIVRALLGAGASPDAANCWGPTPRSWAAQAGLAHLFSDHPEGAPTLPSRRIQNAEHLADHHFPDFQIPERAEREALAVGQAVDIHVHGPRKPAIKVRILRRDRSGAATTYLAYLDPPGQETNLPEGTTEVTFGPEHVATIYLKRP